MVDIQRIRASHRKYLATLLLTSAALVFPSLASAQTDSATDAQAEGEIIVTAGRREEALNKVPIKVDAYSPLDMDRRGMRSIEDIARYTPGLEFTQTGGVQGDVSNSISIRGIASQVGSATTAIYIDDTPIQTRNIGYFGGNPYPRIFDLERVEVLKGPQGTLFGASAQGGAVRFITPQPEFDRVHAYARSEVSLTDHGAPSYEVGAAAGAPLMDGTLAVRISAWTRRDGGYIDQINATTGAIVQKDSDWNRTTVLRGALAFKPSPDILIAPSILYQNLKMNNRSQYWESHSDIANNDFRTGGPLGDKYNDEFYLPALKLEYHGDAVEIYSNTSYFDRKSDIDLDYTTFLRVITGGSPYVQAPGTIPSGALVTTKQKNFTQELRLQSPAGERFEWILGAFYAKQKQASINFTGSNAIGGTAVNGYNYINDTRGTDEQVAGFANAAYTLAEGLKISAGVRVAHLKFSYLSLGDGPVNGGPSTDSGKSSETPVTPRFGISYQVDPDNLIYANVAKGFRQGGAQGRVPASFCAADLASLSLSSSPTSYGSDSVWSYDAGSKNTLLGGKVHVDANAYLIKWNNIQQSVRLANCGFSFIGNLGKATSRGVDLTFDAAITTALQIGANVGYNDTTFDGDVLGGGGALLAGDGDRIGGPRWTGTVWGSVEFPVGDKKAYIRSDFTFRSSGISPNPKTFSYDADLTASKASNVWSMRAGVTVSGVEASLFVNNILNSNEALFRTHDVAGSPLFYAGGYRPRTFGLTATYRY